MSRPLTAPGGPRPAASVHGAGPRRDGHPVRVAVVVMGLSWVLLAAGCAESSAVGSDVASRRTVVPEDPGGTAPVGTATAGATDTVGAEPTTSDTAAPDSETSSTSTSTSVRPSTTMTITDPLTVPPTTDPGAPPAFSYQGCTGGRGGLTHLSFNSNVLRIVAPVQGYYVYTPPCYDLDTARYPVIYLFHGANRDESEWVNHGLVAAADRLITSGEIAPVIIVMADGQDAWVGYDDPVPPFDYFVLYELEPRVEASFRTINHPAFRAIGGISRGGEWALLVASRHPGVFGSVGGHSPAVGVPTNPPATLAPQLAGRGLRIWLDVGSGDSLAPQVNGLSAALRAAGVDHEFRTSPGGHTDAYWGGMVESYLRWYTRPWTSGAR